MSLLLRLGTDYKSQELSRDHPGQHVARAWGPEDRHEGFANDSAVVTAEGQSQISSQGPTCATTRIQSHTPSNWRIKALAPPQRNHFNSQETVSSFYFSQMGRLAPTRTTDSESNTQQPGTFGPGGPLGNQFDSQETVRSFDFSLRATQLVSLLDSDSQTPDGSQEVAAGLPLDNTMTPTTLRQLALTIEDLQLPEEAAVHSQPSDMELAQGGSNNACS